MGAPHRRHHVDRLVDLFYTGNFEARVAGLDRITRDPNVLGGLPCLRGLRFPVWSVLDWLAAGRTPEQLLAEFPFLEVEDIYQALKWAAERLRDDVVVPRAPEAPGGLAQQPPAATASRP